jgi:hypothetical protein
MFFSFFASFLEHFVELAGFFAFFVEADYGFYGVAAAFEFAFFDPLVDLFEGFFGEAELDLSHTVAP